MKIALIGATGMAGGAIATEALSRSHDVFALVRNPGRLRECDRLTVTVADAAEPQSLALTIDKADVVVLAVRLSAGEEDQLAQITRGVLDVAERAGTRVLVIGGAAALKTPTDPDTLVFDDPDFVPELWKAVARASLDQFHACQEFPSEQWVYLSPPAVLEQGSRTGNYRRGRDTLLVDGAGKSRISADDLAIAVVDELESPTGENHFTVAEAGA